MTDPAAGGTPELTYEEFKQAVLEQQIRNAQAMGRHYYPPVPPDELDELEGGHRLRIEAAANCRNLLAAARAALSAERLDPKNTLAVSVASIGVGSSYRDYEHDRNRWFELFPRYYEATRTDRERAEGGAHGRAAIQVLAAYISPRKASPGFRES
jgi:hypothetical protein